MNPRVIVTGAGGYLGSILSEHFCRQGWEVVRWSRQGGDVPFVLGEEPLAARMEGARALLHCAYDFRPSAWQEAHRVNGLGSQKLMAAAVAAKIPRVVFISTMSAFPGCVSMYGRIKLEVEAFGLPRGILCVRPGLLWSSRPGGMYQRLQAAAGRLPVLPLLEGGGQRLAFSQAEDLALGLEKFCRGDAPAPDQAVVTAYPELFSFCKILETLAHRQGRRAILLPVPAFPFLWGLRCAEFVRLPLPFKSDSLLSLLHQDPHPRFSKMIEFRKWPPL